MIGQNRLIVNQEQMNLMIQTYMNKNMLSTLHHGAVHVQEVSEMSGDSDGFEITFIPLEDDAEE